MNKERCGTNKRITVILVCILILLFVMILVVGIWDCVKKGKNEASVTEDINPDYGTEGYDDNEDTAEITDVNDHYNSAKL